MPKKEDKGLDIGAILGKGKPEVEVEIIEIDDDDIFEGIDEDLELAEAELEVKITEIFDGDIDKAAALMEVLKDFLDLHK
jgi:hypothetical protein